MVHSPRSKNGWWGEPVQFFVQHINNCQSFDGSPIQNGSICALPQRGGRTQLRATQKLSEGPYIETETYPKEMEMSASVPFLRHLAALKLHPHHSAIHNHRRSQCVAYIPSSTIKSNEIPPHLASKRKAEATHINTCEHMSTYLSYLSACERCESGYPQVLKGWVGEEKGFDPLGVTDALPVYWVREAELKHGRLCMLATVGWISGVQGRLIACWLVYVGVIIWLFRIFHAIPYTVLMAGDD